jgi:NADH-quinone oxidoreductase subunit J
VLTFWLLAPFIVAAALGLLFVRKAVHAALLLAVVMIGLAIMYAVQDAPFLFAVQIIVYTGAILMLFLFVLMLVGVDASDSVVETLKGQRLMASVAGLLLGVVLVIGLAQVGFGVATGLDEANAEGNVQGLARLLFSDFVFAFEATSALLITAALGAMVLAHRERITPKPSQRDLAARRMRDYAEHGKHLGPLPSPGVFARHNAVDTPALLPDGSPAPTSVSRVLMARGTVRSAPALADDIDELTRSMQYDGVVRPEPAGEQPPSAEDAGTAGSPPGAPDGTAEGAHGTGFAPAGEQSDENGKDQA